MDEPKAFVCVNDALPESIVLVARSEAQARELLEARLVQLGKAHLNCTITELRGKVSNSYQITRINGQLQRDREFLGLARDLARAGLRIVPIADEQK